MHVCGVAHWQDTEPNGVICLAGFEIKPEGRFELNAEGRFQIAFPEYHHHHHHHHHHTPHPAPMEERTNQGVGLTAAAATVGDAGARSG
jgi:hypothetical protein